MQNLDLVILSWNRLELTLSAIESVRSQQNVNAHIWLVDQGSAEACLNPLRQLAANDPQVHLSELGTNRGVAAGRNAGMQLGNSEIIVSLDNDAELKQPDSLARVIKHFDEAPNLAAMGFYVENFYTGEIDLTSWVYPKMLLSKKGKIFLTTRFPGGAHALRRSALEKTTAYDESLFFYWEELDLSYQLINEGYEIIYNPEVMIRHKISPEARTDWKDNRFYYYVRNAIYLDWKYFRSLPRLIMLSAGYQLKALYNGLLKQALRAFRDAALMIFRLSTSEVEPLRESARKYIWENDVRHRGNILSRIRTEVFTRPPG